VRRNRPSPSGLTPADVLVLLFVVLAVLLFAIMGVSRSRESARLAMCQNNLAQIGKALAYYDDAFGSLPYVGDPTPIQSPADLAPPSPLRVMLEALGVASFLGLDPEGGNLPSLRAPTPEGGVIAGFLCPADARATGGLFNSPGSYRATTGSEPGGVDGPFAPGRKTSLPQVERRDGTSFTAAFSERLVGTGRDEEAPENYRIAEVPADPLQAAPNTSGAPWRGDAGSTWRPADFRQTLYNHAIPPGWRSSLVATDGRSASVGASSGHVRGVNVLMLDGSAKVVAPSIDLGVWRAYGSIGPEETSPPRGGPDATAEPPPLPARK